MTNKAFINSKDIVEVKILGEIKYYKLVNFFISIAALSNSLDASGKDVPMLIDLTEATSMEPMAKRIIKTMFGVAIFDRLAVIGANPQLEEDMREIGTASGRGADVKAFPSREEAEEWLLEK